MRKRKTITGKRNRILVLWLVLTTFLINLTILILIPFLMHPELKPFGAPLEILTRPDQPYAPPTVSPASPDKTTGAKDEIPNQADFPENQHIPFGKTTPP